MGNEASLLGRKVRISKSGRNSNPRLSIYSGKDLFTVRAVYVDAMKVRKAMIECPITKCLYEVKADDIVAGHA
jgi:hypothetical protein